MSEGTSDIKQPQGGETSSRLAFTSFVTRSIADALSGFNHGDSTPSAGGQFRFAFRITAASSVETGRWKYTAKLQIRQKSAAGAASYADAPENFTITELWNDAEEKNLSGYTISGSASYGNGVIKADVATGFAIQPIPVGMVVWVMKHDVVSSGAIVPEWSFYMPNGISGVCEP